MEICCGTAQVSRYFASQGWDVVTIDWEARWNPTILADVRTIKPEQLWTPGEFDVIWCSPDCTEFSIALQNRPRNLAKGNSIVIACFDIIRYLTSNTDKQVFWAVENPYTGFLRKQEHMLQWASYLKRADYCKYQKPYQKPTAIWTNLDNWTPRPICCKGCRCESHNGRKHLRDAKTFKQSALYKIPQPLIEELFFCISSFPLRPLPANPICGKSKSESRCSIYMSTPVEPPLPLAADGGRID